MAAADKPSIEDRVTAIEAHLGLTDTNKDPVTAEAQAEADEKAAAKAEKQGEPAPAAEPAAEA
jgi:hypothetical protein